MSGFYLRARSQDVSIRTEVSQSMVCRPIASLASDSLLAMQNLRPHSRPTPEKYIFQKNYTVSPLHTNLQVANFQRREHASGSSKELQAVPSMSGVSDIAACLYLLLLMILQRYHLQSVTPDCSLDASPCVPAVVLYSYTFQGTILQD